MRLCVALPLGALISLTCGCASGPEAANSSRSTAVAESTQGAKTTFAEALQEPWKKLTQSGHSKHAASWEWLTALPSGTTRAEVVVPTVSAPVLARLVPQWPQPEIRL